MDDSAIIDLYLARDETAVSETAEKYGTRLRRIAESILRDPSSAEECENDTYLQTWNRIPPNEPRNYFFAFLGKITRHLAIDECRKQTSRKRQALFVELTDEMTECLAGQSDVESEIDAQELSRTISSFLDTYPLMQRNIFVRRYWYFDSIPEISTRYGFSQSKVKSILFRMRNRLREYLVREGYFI
ncbi:MAG: RNA polymerase sigma factor [Lachnospiraceae bacterium]|nr:RNA polymerase sigma factor [Lachnospiraceae bacterium]